jgi:hypothetical protein
MMTTQQLHLRPQTAANRLVTLSIGRPSTSDGLAVRSCSSHSLIVSSAATSGPVGDVSSIGALTAAERRADAKLARALWTDVALNRARVHSRATTAAAASQATQGSAGYNSEHDRQGKKDPLSRQLRELLSFTLHHGESYSSFE